MMTVLHKRHTAEPEESDSVTQMSHRRARGERQRYTNVTPPTSARSRCSSCELSAAKRAFSSASRAFSARSAL
eukprot:3125885-Pyramimonas_sp.AAC.1